MTDTQLDTFTRQYIETALWAENDQSDERGGEPFDANYSVDDIHPNTLAKMIEDCQDFQTSFGELFTDREELSRAGHDFWLTRNSHGAGFWDGDWSEPMPEALGDETIPVGKWSDVGEFLTAMSKPYGSFNLYIGDDGMIHGD